MQLWQRVDSRAIIGGGRDGRLHRHQVVVAHTGDVQALKLCQSGCSAAAGPTEHRIDGIDHCLQFGGGGNGAAAEDGQGVVDRVEVGGVDARDTSVGVICDRRGTTAKPIGIFRQGGLRLRCSKASRVDHQLQLGQCVHGRAIVWCGGDACLYRW